MNSLAQKKCMPCVAGVAPLKADALKPYLVQMGEGWRVVDEHHLEKEYRFKNFQQALDFTNAIGHVAEQEGHHPDIHLSWGKVKVTFWTHKINGLSEGDFIMAAKCDVCFLARPKI
jgi:4a-hydroxytetrahydrobiopterin dehydratase